MLRLVPHCRGFSRNELLIALSFAALGIVALVFVARPGHAKSAEATNARVNALAAAAREWRSQNESGCPTVGRLIADGFLDENAPRDDRWGGVFRFHCEDERLFLLSDGEDRAVGTSDDQRFLVE